MGLYYLGRKIIQGPRCGFYSIEHNKRKRYWTHRKFEFIVRYEPPKQKALPDVIWHIIWDFSESYRRYQVNSMRFQCYLTCSDELRLLEKKQPGETELATALRVLPKNNNLRRRAQRLLLNF